MKLYVREFEYKKADGDRLIRIKTYQSKPQKPFYIVWM